MNEKAVYAKTSRGTAEVAQRSGSLSLAARRVLIMVDGRRTARELAQLLKPGEIDGVLATLESLGYIQRVGAAEASSTRTGPATRGEFAALDVPTVGGDIGEERNLMTLDEARRRAVRELHERLGPDADLMATRIEQCRTADELRERIREAERLVAGFLGEAAAQDYLRALRRR
jgi:glycosyltransferase involved in cell wall biosynthesis